MPGILLINLMNRLEAATSRLEDMAQPSQGDSPTSHSTNGAAPHASAKAPGQLPAASSVAPATRKVSEPLPVSIESFDTLINQTVTRFVNLSDELGGVVAEQSSSVLRAFGAQRKILIIATRAKKPDVKSSMYMEILTELQRQMGMVGDIRETNRASPLFNHLSAVSEGISALGWITVEPKPAEYINETLGGAQFYGNRVLKEYKEKDRKHVEWVQAFYQIFKSLSAYVKQHYEGGLAWNNKSGIDAKDVLQQMQSPQSTPSAAPQAGSAPPLPPPPPPPPLPTFDNASSQSAPVSSKGGDMDAVFSQLNQGEAVTSGLRKVDRSQMTHKNPSLRSTGAVPTRSDSQTSTSSATRGKSPLPPGKKPKPENMRTKKPPRAELEGNKWIIENFDSPSETVTINASLNHSILISRCRATTIQIQGKANAVSISDSPRLSLIIDSLVSSVDVIKSANFALQVLGALPTILLDQVDGATVYLGAASQHTEIFSSKCSSVNLMVLPQGASDEDGVDYRECPLPEQIKSVIRDGAVFSEIVEHAG
ncbi:MAG: hypothetical protein M1825_004497 [Sarcosagium campestre]|nr:MAG: hypothetical protein M1825_004497 [Sarcosagium campestre]